MKSKFTVKHFVTLPPMWKLSCQKSSFDFGLIFSHLALLLLQKRFFGVKIQYLMSTYVWFILSKWVELPSGWVVPGSCVKIFFSFWSVDFCGGAVKVNYSDPKGSPGKEHHARLVQGLSNWQIWAASPIATFIAFGVQGAVLASAFLCPVCSTSWLGSSWEWDPSHRWARLI